MTIHTFAAIDVGSYELGMKIFEVSRGRGIREIDHVVRRIDLGSDTYATGKLSLHHIQEVRNVLLEYRKIMDTYKVEAYKAYGTSAIREMTNASIILSQWEEETGIHIDVLSNSEQRFLDYKSIAYRGEAFEQIVSEGCAIVDIGGSSIQISLFENGVLNSTQNLKLGVLRIRERLSHIDARTSQMVKLVEEMVDSQIQVFTDLYLQTGTAGNGGLSAGIARLSAGNDRSSAGDDELFAGNGRSSAGNAGTFAGENGTSSGKTGSSAAEKHGEFQTEGGIKADRKNDTAQVSGGKKKKKGSQKSRVIPNIIIVDDYISAFMESVKRDEISTEEFRDFLERNAQRSDYDLMREFRMTEDSILLLHISAIMLNCIIKALNSRKVYAPGVTLADGIVYEYAERKKLIPASHDFDEDILACARNIAARYRSNEERGRSLDAISMKIFDATKKIHGLGKRERFLLRLSCILHDCGKYISMSNAAECAYNIIMKTEIIGISHLEREIVANVVLYNHNDFVYYEEQEEASDLDRDAYLAITKLTAILRLANGLDRAHTKKFDDIRVTVKGEQLVISAKSGVDLTLEKGLFASRAGFFAEVFGITPVIRQRKGS